MDIEIYSDVVCPWCWIGERRLFAALPASPDVTVRWRAFQLDPSAVSEGKPLVEWLGGRYGGEANARRMFTNVTSVAATVGLDMRFDQAVAANTFDAHRLIWWAGTPSGGLDQRPMVEALHKAHFTDGLDVGSLSDLAPVAASLGHDLAWVREMLESDTGVAEVQAELSEARALGVNSVPTFVFDGQYALSGAQEPATFQQVLASLGVASKVSTVDACSVDSSC